MDVLNRLSAFIKQHALFEPEEGILLAVSGGRDSVLMVHLFNEAGLNFGIAHCNFNLRGEESMADERFANDLAAELDVPFFTTEFDTAAYYQEKHISIQMAARELRYSWLEEIRSDFNFKYIAVAQHQNDVMETMLLNLTRGTGVAGMHGILPKKGKIIRPLLFLKREEIDKLVEDKGLSFREDSSNASSKYARNKIRLEVVPVLKELNPSLEQTFELNRKRFEDLEIILNKVLKDLKSELFKEVEADVYEISLADLKNLNPIDTLLYGLFHPFGFSGQVLQDLKRSWDGEPGKVFSSGSHNLQLDRGKIILSKKESIIQDSVEMQTPSSNVKWNGKTYKGEIVPIDLFKLRREASVAQVDFDLLQFPLILRQWKNGDRFYPLGLNGSKKISDFFIEQKIPLGRKKYQAILENGNGDIIWIAGLRIDERYKITTITKKVFIFEQYT